MPLNRYILYATFGQLIEAIRLTNKAPFIVFGTGRCGSSLLTDILNTHSQLTGFSSEANDLWHPHSYPLHEATISTPPFHVDPKTFTELSVGAWPEGYDRFIRRVFAGYQAMFGTGRRTFVKSATICFLIPKLVEIFPDTRFLHVYRNGPSVVESMLLKAKDKIPVSGDTSPAENASSYRLHCAHYWNDCILEVERVNTVLHLAERGRLYELKYEDLCADPRQALKKVAAHLEIRPDAFGYDLGRIKSMNYKVKDRVGSPEWAEALDAMQPALALKGYV